MPGLLDSSNKVLVTGGLGYVGSVLVPLLACKWPVRVYDSMLFGNALEGTPNVEFVKGDMRDTDRLALAVDGCWACIHLAGIVTDELVDLNPGLARKINVTATEVLCERLLAAGAQRLIYASSSSVYGSQDKVCDERTPPKPQTAYAQTKLDAESICLSYASSKMAVCAIRSATCMGPAPRMRLDTIVNIFSKQAWFDQEIKVFGGEQLRSNIHVQDIAELYALLLTLSPPSINGMIWNAVSSFEMAVTIAILVERIYIQKTGRFIKLTIKTDMKDERNYRMRGELIQKDLPWAPKRNLIQAIRDNFDWFAQGKLNPDDDLYYNTRRMAKIMKGES